MVRVRIHSTANRDLFTEIIETVFLKYLVTLCNLLGHTFMLIGLSFEIPYLVTGLNLIMSRNKRI